MEMLILLRNKKGGALRAKDILDINFDMYVDQDAGGKGYCVVVNSRYLLPDVYDTEEEATNAMLSLVAKRNREEEQLDDW